MANPLVDLKTLLQQDLVSLDELNDLLRAERKALARNDMAEVEALVVKKNELLDLLRARAHEKVRHLVAAGYQSSTGHPSTFIGQLKDPALEQLWSAANNAMSNCQAANTVNGQVINHLQKRVGRLSEIIRGASPGQKLYGSAGREEALSHKTVLANA
ncbi:MAG: flagellar biosynthesis protein FlgN [Alteromonadaceae bacterium]|nr:flagellar biosynthesis protein FlgN [Alteromonadaceae bacterium]|tara:strand:+ start:589 stop:1062 length:474 start_codon:yes stop_codon:yes gene_type:complete